MEARKAIDLVRRYRSWPQLFRFAGDVRFLQREGSSIDLYQLSLSAIIDLAPRFLRSVTTGLGGKVPPNVFMRDGFRIGSYNRRIAAVVGRDKLRLFLAQIHDRQQKNVHGKSLLSQ
jgi:formyltetrahydrofolate synthetase